MRKKIFISLIFTLAVLTGCIEAIEFDTGSEPRRLVVEGLISNISYSERMLLPNYSNRFFVKLQWTGPVNNERNDVISDATVQLIDNEGGSWDYYWSASEEYYILQDDDFKADEDHTYQLFIRLADGKVYESQPEKMHASEPIREVSYNLVTRLQEIDINGQTTFEEQEGLVLSAMIPEHSDDENYYYRWKVTPSWVYIAPLAQLDNPVRTCYVTNKYFFQKIFTRLDRTGGYPFELFFLETVNNQRLFEDFSVNVTQYSLSPAAYEFWDELALQQESGGGIFDPPPFELSGNVYNVDNPDEKVSGFFSVAHESSVRWFINGSELPYDVDLGIDPCFPPPGVPNIPTPDCLNCLDYKGGSSYNTTIKPDWWRQY